MALARPASCPRRQLVPANAAAASFLKLPGRPDTCLRQHPFRRNGFRWRLLGRRWLRWGRDWLNCFGWRGGRTDHLQRCCRWCFWRSWSGRCRFPRLGHAPQPDTLPISARLRATLLAPRLGLAIVGRCPTASPDPCRLTARFTAVAAQGMRRAEPSRAPLQQTAPTTSAVTDARLPNRAQAIMMNWAQGSWYSQPVKSRSGVLALLRGVSSKPHRHLPDDALLPILIGQRRRVSSKPLPGPRPPETNYSAPVPWLRKTGSLLGRAPQA
jgi:hypothetical protein